MEIEEEPEPHPPPAQAPGQAHGSVIQEWSLGSCGCFHSSPHIRLPVSGPGASKTRVLQGGPQVRGGKDREEEATAQREGQRQRDAQKDSETHNEGHRGSHTQRKVELEMERGTG